MAENLQKRSGLNTGNEPTAGNFIDKAGQGRVVMSGNAEATLLEGVAENGRTTMAASCPAWNSDAAIVGYQTSYYNTFGDRIVSVAGALPAGPDMQQLTTQEFLPAGITGSPLVMVEGEKYTVKRAVSQGAPGTADVTIFPQHKDIKIKPKPKGGGGLSDGNIHRVREVITAQGVEIQPPPGKAWKAVDLFYPQGLDVIGHFGLTGDNPATIEIYLVDEDGVARLIESAGPLSAQSINAVNGFFFAGNNPLAYPRKLRYKLVAGKLPIPVGRVLLMSAYTEYDLPQ